MQIPHKSLGTKRAKLTTIIVIVVILAIAGGIWMKQQSQDTDSTTSQTSTSAPSLSDKVGQSVDIFGQVCERDGKPYKEAEAYKTGELPYHYAIVGQAHDGSPGGVSAGPGANDFRMVTLEPHRMQLTGCLTRFNEKNTGIRCTFLDGSTTTIYISDYRLDIYETSTRKFLKTATVSKASDPACPKEDSPEYASSPGPKAFVGPDYTAIHEIFRPFSGL